MKEAKEEAKRLVELLYKADEVDVPTGLMEWGLAKQCAIICVEEKIEALDNLLLRPSESYSWKSVETKIKELNNIKTEIEKYEREM